MPTAKPVGRANKRVRRRDRRRPAGGAGTEEGRLSQFWRRDFFAQLAETSNIRKACEVAGINPSTVYDLRRRDVNFAQRWNAALCEGYDNLEMEMLQNLRTCEAGASVPKYNYAAAMRMLLAHRETVQREKARRVDVSAAEIQASIELKVAQMRDRVLAREAAEAAEAQRTAEVEADDGD